MSLLQPENPNFPTAQAFLEAVAREFQTRVTFFALDWSEEALRDVCSSLSPEPSTGKQVVTVQG